MNTIKGKVNKIILGLTSVGLVLLMLPVSLSANHFRYGTMSWEPISDNGTHITIRLKSKMDGLPIMVILGPAPTTQIPIQVLVLNGVVASGSLDT